MLSDNALQELTKALPGEVNITLTGDNQMIFLVILFKNIRCTDWQTIARLRYKSLWLHYSEMVLESVTIQKAANEMVLLFSEFVGTL